MAAKMSKSALRSSANGHTDLKKNAASMKQEKVVILDAGAQYGKVSLESVKRFGFFEVLHTALTAVSCL
jgi:hypothetical protein